MDLFFFLIICAGTFALFALFGAVFELINIAIYKATRPLWRMYKDD